jgi:oxygen-independent coproporphyrinogen-3 oxidase
LIEPFVNALINEIRIVARSRPAQSIGTIFFGGGTPSQLSVGQFSCILDALRESFIVPRDAEISLEVNPADVTLEYFTALRKLGFNRVSIGMQSANANELRLFNRRHDNDAVARAVRAARGAEFTNLNLDLIYGIPHQSVGDWENTLRQMFALRPEHISLYALTLEDGTPLKSWIEKGSLPPPDDDISADMYDLATEMLNIEGYEQYEISNWAKPGHQCQHNLQYWRNLPYLGLGPGAHGFADGVRYSVILSPQKYIKLLESMSGNFEYPHTPVTAQAVVVDRDADISETLIMGLRLTKEGISRAAFRQRFGIDFVELYHDVIRKYVGFGLIKYDDDRVMITQKGRLLSSAIFRELV